MTITEQLVKNANVPAVPGTPGSPGTPGIPGSPAYCIDIPTTSTGFRVITIQPAGPGGYPPAIQIVVPYGTITTYTHQCFPAIPAQPPNPATPGTSAQPAQYVLGWNSGAVSGAHMPNGYMYSFQVPTSVVGVVAGLAPYDCTGNEQLITFGLYFSNQTVQVSEAGVLKGSGVVYAATDTFYITQMGSQITYWQNSTLLYTSTIAYPDLLYANASLYGAGDSIDNSQFIPADSTHGGVTGNAAGVLKKLRGFALANGANAGGYTQATLRYPLVGAATGTMAVNGSVTAQLKKLRGFALANGANPGGWASQYYTGRYPQLVGYGESGLYQPPYALVSSNLQKLSGFSYATCSFIGNATGVLRKLRGFALANGANPGGWNSEYWNGRYPQLVGGGYASGGANWNIFLGWFTRPAPLYNLTAYAEQDYGPEGFYGTLSGYSLFAYTNSVFRGALSGYSLTATGASQNGCTFQGVLSGYSLNATATVTQGSGLQGVYGITRRPKGAYQLYAYTGAVFQGSYSGAWTLNGQGYTIPAATFRGQLSSWYGSLTASASAENYAICNGNLGRRLRMLPQSTFIGSAPRLTLVATAIPVVTVEYEGYAVAFVKDYKGEEQYAVTHYTSFPFDRIVRFGTQYYGVASNGLFQITGNSANGTPIIATVASAETDFGERHLKRPVSLTLSGRISTDLDVTVSSAEFEVDSYTYRNEMQAGERNQRVRFGKGIKARYMSFSFSNTLGNYFEIDNETFEAEILKRIA